MKIILFAFGLWFVYWNCCGLSENLSAIWHFIALLLTSITLVVLTMRWFFDWLCVQMTG
jgi:hypothetical protein